MALPSDLPFKLSILDQSPIAEGCTAGDALRNSLDLAQLADRLGYHRYWVAEHHGTPALACNSPEVLIGPIAATTSTIRVGSGGVMLPHYSPLKVAENFSMLEALYPGRIDLGIGRAAGTSPNVTFALQRDRRQLAPDDFPDQLAELMALFANRRPGPQKGLPMLPLHFPQFASPELSLLGSSAQSAIWAAELGLPYVFADFINPEGSAIAAHYRAEFQPSPNLASPRTAIAAWVICAETDEEAERLSSSSRMMLRLLHRGRLIAIPSPELALRFLDSDDAPPSFGPARRFITGSPATVRASLEAIAREYRAEEIFVVNIMYDHAARRRSYELLAEAFSGVSTGLPPHKSFEPSSREHSHRRIDHEPVAR